MNRDELRDIRRQSYLLTPLPELQFQNQRVTPARLQATVEREHGQVTHFELDLLLKTPLQVHVFQNFLSQFQPVEVIQALAYLPDLELHLIFEARPVLLDWMQQHKQTEPAAKGFLNAGELSPLADLDTFYTFKQYESVPV